LFSQEQELAEVAALQYYVEYGRDMSKGRLMDLLGSYIPDTYLDTARGPEKWVHLIEDAYKKVSDSLYHFR
jgi:myosin-7